MKQKELRALADRMLVENLRRVSDPDMSRLVATAWLRTGQTISITHRDQTAVRDIIGSMWPGAVPGQPAAWRVVGLRPSSPADAEKILRDLNKQEQTEGDDTLVIGVVPEYPGAGEERRYEYRASTSVEEKDGALKVKMRVGRVVVEPMFFEIMPVGAEPLTDDGFPIVSISLRTPCGVLADFLARRMKPDGFSWLPSEAEYLQPGTPSIGEMKRRRNRKDGRPLFDILRDRRGLSSVPSQVVFRLDHPASGIRTEGSRMLVADERIERRSVAVQMSIPWEKVFPAIPAHAHDAEVLALRDDGIFGVLCGWDVSCLMTLDAVLATLVDCGRDKSISMSELLTEVTRKRCGDPRAANAKQRRAWQEDLNLIAQTGFEISRSTGGKTQSASWPLLIVTAEARERVDATGTTTYEERFVRLTPDLYPSHGKGILVSDEYFRLDPRADEWGVRIGRYLFSRWSKNSLSDEADSEDWSRSWRLSTVLGMSGVDLTRADRRGLPEAWGKLKRALETLRSSDLVGSYSIEGEGGRIEDATIEIAPPAAWRKAIAAARPKAFERVQQRRLTRSKADTSAVKADTSAVKADTSAEGQGDATL